MTNQSKRWCFTLNNYTDDDISTLNQIGDDLGRNGIQYLVFGRELADTGTPHLQGFVITCTNHRLRSLQSLLCLPNPHYECARGTSCQAADYCKKDGDFVEFGQPPVPGRPKQPSVADFCVWVSDQFASTSLPPSDRAIANAFPSLYLRYGSGKLLSLSAHLLPVQQLENAELRPWQLELEQRLNGGADDRSVVFVIDTEGGKGKSFFSRWYYTKYSERTQLLGVGKRDDIALAIDVSKSVFFFNVPRTCMEFLQYPILEMMKDRVVFSPKYLSVTKVMNGLSHVVVLCNEEPDYTKMSSDRYITINL